MKKEVASIPFTTYQKYAIFILAITQFSVILDFMIMSPLGDTMMKSLSMKPSQFGLAVSAYAFSAGISGLLTAGFADKYDRKKLLLFFYTGFILGTLLCGVANNFLFLIVARVVTGLFGGVIGSISMAIITDIFDIHHRGRVMGFIQMGFGASQVLGVPISLYLANIGGWQSPFIMVAVLSLAIAVFIVIKMRPVTKHLELQHDRNALSHLLRTVAKKDYRVAFMATALLSIGGFMMMPFGSAFAINNLRISAQQLPTLFMVGGVSTLLFMPLVGKLSDKVDKFKIFVGGSLWMIVVVILYTHLGVSPLWLAIVFNILMMFGIMSRMIPSSALTTGIPEMEDRGAFMSINASLSQIAGGIAAAVGGMIVVQKDKFSPLEHYDTLGYVVCGVTFVAMLLVYRVDRVVKRKLHESKV